MARVRSTHSEDGAGPRGRQETTHQDRAVAGKRDLCGRYRSLCRHQGEIAAAERPEAGVEELRRMLSDARRSTQAWLAFLDDFVSDPDVASRLRSQIWAGARFLETADCG